MDYIAEEEFRGWEEVLSGRLIIKLGREKVVKAAEQAIGKKATCKIN